MNLRRLALFAVFLGLGAASHAEVVMETDDALATLSGTWTKSSSVAGYYGVGVAYTTVSTTAQTARFFSPKPITTTGTWCAQARWTAGTTRSATAAYQIYDGATLRSTVNVDQRINGGAWRTLACVPMTAAKTAEIRLLNSSGASGSLVVADAVRWVYEESSAQSLCLLVGGGQAAGGGTYVGQGMSVPANGTCKPWSGFLKTASTVVAFSTGSGCTSSDGKVFTATLASTNPSFFGPGTIVSDHIQLCLTGTCPAKISQSDVSSYFGTTSVATTTCTSTILSLPSSHD